MESLGGNLNKPAATGKETPIYTLAGSSEYQVDPQATLGSHRDKPAKSTAYSALLRNVCDSATLSRIKKVKTANPNWSDVSASKKAVHNGARSIPLSAYADILPCRPSSMEAMLAADLSVEDMRATPVKDKGPSVIVASLRARGFLSEKLCALAGRMLDEGYLLPPSPVEILHNRNCNFDLNQVFVLLRPIQRVTIFSPGDADAPGTAADEGALPAPPRVYPPDSVSNNNSGSAQAAPSHSDGAVHIAHLTFHDEPSGTPVAETIRVPNYQLAKENLARLTREVGGFPKVDFITAQGSAALAERIGLVLSNYGSLTGFRVIMPSEFRQKDHGEIVRLFNQNIPRVCMGYTLTIVDAERLLHDIGLLPAVASKTELSIAFKRAVYAQTRLVRGFARYSPESNLYAIYQTLGSEQTNPLGTSIGAARVAQYNNISRLCYIGFLYLVYFVAEDVLRRALYPHAEYGSVAGVPVQKGVSAQRGAAAGEVADSASANFRTGKAGAAFRGLLQSARPHAKIAEAYEFPEGSTADISRQFNECYNPAPVVETPYDTYKYNAFVDDVETFYTMEYRWSLAYAYTAILDRYILNRVDATPVADPTVYLARTGEAAAGLPLYSQIRANRRLLAPRVQDYPETVRAMMQSVATIRACFLDFSIDHKGALIDHTGLFGVIRRVGVHGVLPLRFAQDVVLYNYTTFDQQRYVPGLTVEEFLTAIFVCSNFALCREPYVRVMKTPESRVAYFLQRMTSKVG